MNLSDLSKKKQRAIELRAEGVGMEEISKEVGVVERTVHRWFGPDGSLLSYLEAHQAFLADELKKREMDLADVIAGDMKEAWQDLKGLSKTAEKESVRAECLNSMLDRGGQPRLSQSRAEVTTKDISDEAKQKVNDRFKELTANLTAGQLALLK